MDSFCSWLMEEWVETDYEPILNHTRILCNFGEKVAGYFVRWLAQMI